MVGTKDNYTNAQYDNRRRRRSADGSLPLGIEEIARCVRGHWLVESVHWYLDVTFREDGNQTLEKHGPII